MTKVSFSINNWGAFDLNIGTRRDVGHQNATADLNCKRDFLPVEPPTGKFKPRDSNLKNGSLKFFSLIEIRPLFAHFT